MDLLIFTSAQSTAKTAVRVFMFSKVKPCIYYAW